jgi:cytochrome bd-type quinol oxidase subunit 2
MSLGFTMLCGAYVGGAISKHVVGALLGAFTALPIGAGTALIVWSVGALFLQTSQSGSSPESQRSLSARVLFGLILGTIVGLVLTILVLAALAAPVSAVIYPAGTALLVALTGIACPPVQKCTCDINPPVCNPK